MADEMIPEDIRAFIIENIDSIAQIEGLLLLRANPGQRWSAADIAKRLYIGQPEAELFLNQLVGRNLVSASGDQPLLYEYRTNLDPDKKVQCMAETYSRFLLPVTHLIHSKASVKVQQFADAFKIKKGDA